MQSTVRCVRIEIRMTLFTFLRVGYLTSLYVYKCLWPNVLNDPNPKSLTLSETCYTELYTFCTGYRLTF